MHVKSNIPRSNYSALTYFESIVIFISQMWKTLMIEICYQGYNYQRDSIGLVPKWWQVMGFLPDTLNCRLRMRRECRERFPYHHFQMKPLASDPGMHHGACVTHVPWCMSVPLMRSAGENVPRIPGAYATRNFPYLTRGPLPETFLA